MDKIFNAFPTALVKAGCAGITKKEERRKLIKDRSYPWGRPFARPKIVQTLDECILIVSKQVAEGFQLNENVEGWHSYGSGYCQNIARKIKCLLNS